MWSINNTTPYAAEGTWVRDKTGLHHWVVVIKGTFDVNTSGKVSLSDAQVEPTLVPEFYDPAGQASLRYDADLVDRKPTTDILLLGSAHSPYGRPVRKLGVSLRVGPVHKELVVFGTRMYEPSPFGATLSSPAEFQVFALTYEGAYGGSDFADADPRRHVMDARNPVGKGIAFTADRLIDTPGHSIEYPVGDPRKAGPAGFWPAGELLVATPEACRHL
jgi:hypothetical protein